ncbi:hypothetical protein FNV43_RR01654 [Rhamnella rubrinervis]|uniref:Disease resistance protein winged helix domain-containing protein n=1 Tax=Rhamnella rubrinervis TaxID=2594499 RepID=A0A8K0MSH5_9ROSA|nr:hypothetical protein FNV43_RR01654 [Rhamnella rubrinervis]
MKRDYLREVKDQVRILKHDLIIMNAFFKDFAEKNVSHIVTELIDQTNGVALEYLFLNTGLVGFCSESCSELIGGPNSGGIVAEHDGASSVEGKSSSVKDLHTMYDEDLEAKLREDLSKGFEISTTNLINLWISEGLIEHIGNKKVDAVAENYLD